MTRWSLGLLAVLLIGCGHGTQRPDGSTRGGIELTNDIAVVFDDPVRTVPFETRDVRLKRASEQLAQHVGHRVEFHVDTALLPQYESSFQDALIETIEGMARVIADFKDSTHPLLFSDLMATLHQVDVRYDASLDTRSGYRMKLSLETHTLSVSMDGVGSTFVPGRLFWEELYQAQSMVALLRFDGTMPAAVPADLRGYYLFYLEALANSSNVSLRSALVADLVDADPGLDAIRLAIGLHDLVDDPELKDEVVKFIRKRGIWRFYGLPEQNPEVVGAMDPASKYRRTRLTWSKWMFEHLWTMPQNDREVYLRYVFGERGTPLFTDVDPMRVGKSIIDQWIEEGRPTRHGYSSPKTSSARYLCLIDVEHEARDPSCISTFYTYAWSDPRRQKQLIDMVVALKEPLLMRFLTAWVDYKHDAKDVLALWNDVSHDDVAWRAVGQQVAASQLGRSMMDQLQQMWRKWPARRGTVLYVVTMHVRTMLEYYRKDFWKDFRTDFGTVSASTWESFLEHGPRAVATAWIVLPVVGRFDRGTALGRHLDVLLDDPHLEYDRFGKPVETLEKAIEGMCNNRGRGEMKSLRTAIDARVSRKPEEDKMLARAKRLTKC